MKSFIDMRYSWQDVLYTAMYLNATTGQPMIMATTMWNNDANVHKSQNDHFLLEALPPALYVRSRT